MLLSEKQKRLEEGDGTNEELEPGEEERDLDKKEPTRCDSFDPNAIYGPTGFGTTNWVIRDQVFDYTIQYENIMSATASAQQVVIVHQLGGHLDWSTFRLGDMGFGDTYITVPPGRTFNATHLTQFADAFGFYVEVIGQFTRRLAGLNGRSPPWIRCPTT